MRAVRFYHLLLLAGILSCNTPDPASRPTGGDALPSTVVNIDVSRDTTVATPGGAILKIPAGALDAGGATSVKLEVKEAFLLEDMIRGKLFTRSEEQLLSSGGMIYINAAAGQSVTIHQPITVMIPTSGVQHGMMVYEGQVDTGGNVGWINPRPLADVSAGGSEGNGKSIFETNCGSCHGMKEEMTGPPLAWITDRRDSRWLADYIRNNARMLWRGDAYSCFLFNKYKKAAMPVAHLSDADVEQLLVYIRNASQDIDSNSVPDLKRTYDSCTTADPYCDGVTAKTSADYTQPKSGIVATSSVAGTGGAVADGSGATGGAGGAGATTGAGGVGSTGGALGANFYGFTLDKFGWNGVGILEKDLPGVVESDLAVQVKGASHDRTEVFLGIPSLKLLEKGAFAADRNEYYFYSPDGKIPLPQGVAAYVVVRSEKDGQVLFGKAKWITGRQQVVSAEPTAMSPEDITHAIHQLPFDSADMQHATAVDAGAGASPMGSADSPVTAGTGGSDAGTGGSDAGTSGSDAGTSGSMAPKRRGGHKSRAVEQVRACPCWCDEMDYRKADSIARAAGVGQ